MRASLLKTTERLHQKALLIMMMLDIELHKISLYAMFVCYFGCIESRFHYRTSDRFAMGHHQ